MNPTIELSTLNTLPTVGFYRRNVSTGKIIKKIHVIIYQTGQAANDKAAEIANDPDLSLVFVTDAKVLYNT